MLKCEACGHEVEGLICPTCGKENLSDARYCSYCAASMSTRSVQADAASGDVDPYDIDNRILCSDDNCIGIIENGVCTECGKPYQPNRD